MRTGTGHQKEKKKKKGNAKFVTKQQAPAFFTVEGTYEGVIEARQLVVLLSKTFRSKERLKNIL